MKLYKYRDLSNPDEGAFLRLHKMLHQRAFWCARPDTLNDPVELAWTCDYSPTDDTVTLLSGLLQARGRSPDAARSLAAEAIESGRLEVLAEPVIAELIQQCRNEIGLVCFGTAPDNETLWRRYGGAGAGVCVEIDVPNRLLGDHLFTVEYPKAKRIHIDQLCRAHVQSEHSEIVYRLALLSKPECWAPEGEVRFVSKRQSVSVVIDGSRILRVFAGDRLKPSVMRRLETVADPIRVVPRGATKTA